MDKTLITCLVVLVLWTLISQGQTKEPTVPKQQPPKPKIPMSKAYSEMLDIIKDATEARQLRCINALLIDFQYNYRHENADEVKTFVNDILAEKKTKLSELAGKPTLIFS